MADLVHQVLDRQADELVEDRVGEVGDLLAGHVANGDSGMRVMPVSGSACVR